MKLRIHPEAEADIREVASWYESQRIGLGVEFFIALDAGLARVAYNPQLCSRLETWTADGDIRRLVLPRFPYVVIYEVVGDEVHVLAVAHGRRRPHYWRLRRASS